MEQVLQFCLQRRQTERFGGASPGSHPFQCHRARGAPCLLLHFSANLLPKEGVCSALACLYQRCRKRTGIFG